MNLKYLTVLLLLGWAACNVNDMENDGLYPNYEGNDLGLTYTKEASTFKVWSPVATAMTLRLYDKGEGGEALETIEMEQGDAGVWQKTLTGDYVNKYYTFQIEHEGKWLNEVPDPYAKATGVNGARAMVVDLATTNPDGWEEDVRPSLASFSDIILYELHIRDLSAHPNSGIQNAKKYLGLTEIGTKNEAGLATGLSHIKEMGVTHIHLLPVYDFMPRSIDERNPDEQYNWGYDPQNYNVPEGAYSTDPYDGNVRIKEFKTMVKTLHDNGLRVVMDVVYNHTGVTEESNFNQLVPKYYYRLKEDGTFSNASACGNETASEKFMVRKFMLESMKYWVEEYHVDGFRVDLMGIHDIETMNLIAEELRKIDPTIFIYGEGWTAGDSPLPVEKRALKAHTQQFKGVAAFSDDIRDGLKGSVFEHEDRGFVSGKSGMEETIKFGVVAATEHPQVKPSMVNYSDTFWSPSPHQTITYVSCHDNHTLFDKLAISNADDDEVTRLKMHRLAGSIVMTSQGVPFLHAGVELARSKNGVENSFETPDEINRIDWSRKKTYQQHFEYYKALVQLRKEHPAFRMANTADIQKHLKFLEDTPSGVVAYQLSDYANGDAWKDILVIYNGNASSVEVPINDGKWMIMWDGERYDLKKGLGTTTKPAVSVAPITMMILMKE